MRWEEAKYIELSPCSSLLCDSFSTLKCKIQALDEKLSFRLGGIEGKKTKTKFVTLCLPLELESLRKFQVR